MSWARSEEKIFLKPGIISFAFKFCQLVNKIKAYANMPKTNCYHTKGCKKKYLIFFTKIQGYFFRYKKTACIIAETVNNEIQIPAEKSIFFHTAYG